MDVLRAIRWVILRWAPNFTGEKMLNTFCPGRRSNRDLLRGSQTLYRVAIKASLYHEAVQVCIIPNITTLAFTCPTFQASSWPMWLRKSFWVRTTARLLAWQTYPEQTEREGTVGSMSVPYASCLEIDPRVRHILSWRFSLFRWLKKSKLPVTIETMCNKTW